MNELQPDLEEEFWGSKASKNGKSLLLDEDGPTWELAMLTMIIILVFLIAGFFTGMYYQGNKQDKMTGIETSTSLIEKSELKIHEQNKYPGM